MVERIRTLLESRQLTPTQFADTIGVARPIVSHILSGRNKPSLEVVQRILAAMPDLAMPWLLNGTGEMLAAPAARSIAITTTAPAPVAPAPTASAVHPPLAASQLATDTPAASGVPAVSPATAGPIPAAINQPVRPLAKTPVRFSATRDSGPQSPGNGPMNQILGNAPISGRGSIRSAPRTAAVPKRFSAPAKVSASPSAPKVGPKAAEPAPMPPVAAPALAVAAAMPVAPPLAAPPEQPVPVAGVPPTSASSDDAPASSLASALFAGGEKPIRRIVIFYRDGSFADYQPE